MSNMSPRSKMLGKLLICAPAQFRRNFGNKNSVLFVVIFVFLTCSMLTTFSIPEVQDRKMNFKSVLEPRSLSVNDNTTKVILLWTTYFGKMVWYEESKNVFKTECQMGCEITNDRRRIREAHAVVFYLADITWQGQLGYGFSNFLPKYRHPDQIWIFYNLEPWTMIWGNMAAWQGVFNWTMSYVSSSDVYVPYGAYKALSNSEKEIAEKDKKLKEANYFGDKPLAEAVAMISHCSDEAERYKIIGTLRKYINIRILGRCGEQCPSTYKSCVKLLNPYKFYLAFENSDCVEYVSEKYWRALRRNQLPVVAWRLPMEGYVIPGSYINVIDFPDIDAAGLYIAEVARNATLYNSYFQWKYTHKIAEITGWCALCEKLHRTDTPRMVYHDLNGWIYNNSQTCRPLTLAKLISRKIDRFTFDGRLYA